MTATVKPEKASNKNVLWSSNNTSVAIVDNEGKVTAISEGIATITAKTSNRGLIAQSEITVSIPGRDFYMTYGSGTYDVYAAIKNSYSTSDYGPVLRWSNSSNLSGKKVKITAAGYGTTFDGNSLPYTASFNMNRPQNHVKKTITVTFSGSQFPIRFQYTDSWVRIYDIEVLD